MVTCALVPEDTRDAILDAAREAFAREGAAAGLRSIASQAGVTHAAIYRHFACKDDLLSALAQGDFAQLVEEIRDRVPARAGPRHRLEAILTGFVRVGLDNPNLFEFLFWTLPRTSGADVAAANDVFALVRASVAACLDAGSFDRAGPASGDVGSGTDADRLTGFLLTACIGYVARAFVRPQTAHDQIVDYVAFLLGGNRGPR